MIGARAGALAITVALAGAVGCDKGEGGAGGGPREAALAAWKAGGLEASPLTPATVDVGADCQSGTVGAIDVLLCVFPGDTEAKAAEDEALAWVGETTGAALAKGALVVAAADRRKSDPSGRTINQLMKLTPAWSPKSGAPAKGGATPAKPAAK